MSGFTSSKSWGEELMSLVEDTGLRYNADTVGVPTPAFETEMPGFRIGEAVEGELGESESFKDHVKGFAKAWGEMVFELGKGCKDIVVQNYLTEDSYAVRKLRGPVAKVSGRLRYLNEYLPEDRDPFHAWSVIILVFFLAFAVLNVNNGHDSSVPRAKKVYIHPPSATRILLPDGRHMAYREQGVPRDRARYSLIAPHGFLSSRLAGIPGVKESLLEEFGVRLITYDLPGFGESDPHPKRNLNTSALDMVDLANAAGVNDKFWVLGFSSGAMHAWAALKYIPSRIAAMFAPMVNPYESSMTKEEMSGTWEMWVQRRKLMYNLARRFPTLLGYFYSQTFLSGKHGQIDKWLSLSLGNKDKALTEKTEFQEFWHRDVEESIRHLSTQPFIEEAVLLVSSWGFKLADLQVQKKCPGKGIFPWLKFMYSQAECELTGFLGPVHIWQGMDDLVVPSSMIDYVARVLPSAIVHRFPDEGHFSYFFFCDECHRQILSTLFRSPQGPLASTNQPQSEVDEHTVSARK
ncbi:uncharacterized protein LOC131327175 isoform X2 [Rhododendron vialii]|uniref:uncharacterized protein LOC131327175 isoform X2 n=1 Tax=Rhododendron vialii TaxID=182163 RepID=UPI00265E00F8|nr:uncharacterized protein LOC131327175 isoform X2 [Rhododendron vialii]